MRKFTLLLAMGLSMSISAANPKFETPNTGKIYTLEELSTIEESGVTKTGELTYTAVNDIEFKGDDGFTFENNTTLKMGPNVLFRVYGPTQFAVTDTATVCPTEDGVKPKGFHIYKMDDNNRTISHTRFEGASLSVGSEKGVVFENCTFYKSNGNYTKYGITFSGASVNNVVRNCYFLNSLFSAMGNGSNVAAGITIENNIFENCSTEGRNYPYINVCPSGDNGGTYIRNNKIIGGKGLMAGAISMSNMLGMLGENKVVIENNELSDCRYGINLLGYINSRVINNKIVNCHYEANAMNGGSGITINCSSNTYIGKAYLEGNHIEGSLWGVTVIGTAQVNLGCLDKDNDSVEYNPGGNVFLNNGNCGKAPEGETTAYDPSIPYDLYNNTTSTIYAQGNIWGGVDQTESEIEKYIYHKNDDENLGEVIFMPAGTSAITLTEDKSVFEIQTLGNHSFTVSGVAEGTAVTVYDFNGVALWKGVAGQTVTLSRGGVVIVAVGNVARRIIL